MIKLLTLLTKRPTDKTINISNIVWGAIYIVIMSLNLIYLNKDINTSYFGNDLSIYSDYIKYVIIAIWLFPIWLWIYGKPIAKSRNTRILQIIFSILIFVISSAILIEVNTMNFDTLIFLMAFFPLFAWISWKFITKDGLRYWEKVTKVRI